MNAAFVPRKLFEEYEAIQVLCYQALYQIDREKGIWDRLKCASALLKQCAEKSYAEIKGNQNCIDEVVDFIESWHYDKERNVDAQSWTFAEAEANRKQKPFLIKIETKCDLKSKIRSYCTSSEGTLVKCEHAQRTSHN